jgi:chemotaxis protein MotB
MLLSVLHRLNPVSAREEENPLWLIVLCDMMTNLMLFFLIMYGFTRQPENERNKAMAAMSSGFREEKAAAVEQKAEEVIRKTQEEDVTSVLKDKDFAQVEVNEQRIRVTLTNPVLFVSGEAVLSPEAKRELSELAPVLTQLPNPVLVEGHTDNVPLRSSPYGSNWELSVARASAVVDFLTAAAALPPGRFLVAGYGEYRPVAANLTAEGRARNRRIEINILRKSA